VLRGRGSREGPGKRTEEERDECACSLYRYSRRGGSRFHLIGPGVNKTTSVVAVGKKTWRLALRSGTYRYVCDPHATLMKGKFIVKAP